MYNLEWTKTEPKVGSRKKTLVKRPLHSPEKSTCSRSAPRAKLKIKTFMVQSLIPHPINTFTGGERSHPERPSHSLPLNAPLSGTMHKETIHQISWHAKHSLKSLKCFFFLKNISLVIEANSKGPIHLSSTQIPIPPPPTQIPVPKTFINSDGSKPLERSTDIAEVSAQWRLQTQAACM